MPRAGDTILQIGFALGVVVCLLAAIAFGIAGASGRMTSDAAAGGVTFCVIAGFVSLVGYGVVR